MFINTNFSNSSILNHFSNLWYSNEWIRNAKLLSSDRKLITKKKRPMQEKAYHKNRWTRREFQQQKNSIKKITKSLSHWSTVSNQKVHFTSFLGVAYIRWVSAVQTRHVSNQKPSEDGEYVDNLIVLNHFCQYDRNMLHKYHFCWICLMLCKILCRPSVIITAQ